MGTLLNSFLQILTYFNNLKYLKSWNLFRYIFAIPNAIIVDKEKIQAANKSGFIIVNNNPDNVRKTPGNIKFINIITYCSNVELLQFKDITLKDVVKNQLILEITYHS